MFGKILTKIRKLRGVRWLDNEIVVPAKVLGDIFGVGDRMIRQLAEDGVCKKSGTNKYLLMESTKNYIKTLKIAKSPTSSSHDFKDLKEEQADHEYLKKQITDLKLQLMRGEVHKASDVEAVVTDMLQRFKSKITSLPAKLARKVEGEDKKEIQRILKKELDDALTELSEYKASDYYSDEHIDVSDESVNHLIESVRDDKDE